MKTLKQYIFESLPKEINLSFFQALMISNVCDKYFFGSKWEESAGSISNKYNDIDLYKNLSNEGMSKLNQLKGDDYVNYFGKIDGTYKIKNLSEKEAKDLIAMIKDFTEDKRNEKLYGEDGMTCLREIEGMLFHNVK